MKFLVVEGATAAREAISLALLPRGIKALPVANRLAAWEALRADSSIQGAIVDVDDRAVEGVRLVEEIKADESTRGISVIVHTSQANKTFVVRLIETGAAGFLLGAFTPQTGPDRLDRALARLAGHDRQRRHIRVRPDPGEMVRVSFRLPGGTALLSGLVVDISLGGMAIELLNPPPDGAPGTGRPDPPALHLAHRARALARRYRGDVPGPHRCRAFRNARRRGSDRARALYLPKDFGVTLRVHAGRTR